MSKKQFDISYHDKEGDWMDSDDSFVSKAAAIKHAAERLSAKAEWSHAIVTEKRDVAQVSIEHVTKVIAQ